MVPKKVDNFCRRVAFLNFALMVTLLIFSQYLIYAEGFIFSPLIYPGIMAVLTAQGLNYGYNYYGVNYCYYNGFILSFSALLWLAVSIHLSASEFHGTLLTLIAYIMTGVSWATAWYMRGIYFLK